MRAVLLTLLSLAFPAQADPLFIDRSGALPVAHEYTGGWTHFTGGGVAIFDCNGDARPDLYAAGGESPAHLFVNTTKAPGDAVSFALGDAPGLTDTTGAYPLDIDGDGALDLAVLRVGPDVLLRGHGDCTFTDASAEWGFAPRDAWTTAFTATWERGQTRPTLVFGHYVDRANPEGPFGACDTSDLYRPKNGAYSAPEIIAPGFCTLSMLISDWLRAGTPELRISNDRHYFVKNGYEQMFHLNPLVERQESWPKIALWGMGIASQDITGDGLPEVMMTSMGDQLLQFNTGSGFENAPYSIGTYAQRPFNGEDGRPSTGWHAEFGDIDNDGRMDLFIAKGNVEEMPSNAMKDPNNLLMQMPDGTFVETADLAGIDTVKRSRGAGLADLDGDGRLDLVVINRRAPMEVWQNATKDTGHWLAVDLRMPHNSRAVGAWVEVKTGGKVTAREVTVGGGHAGGQALPIHFGLGASESAEARVIWPDGQITDWVMFAADQTVQIMH
jgi:enediyne biosynthesis protein E4